MTSPTPPPSRGRGRGRGKDLTPNERVTQWVNQREARRLNKERWANRTSETGSPNGDKENDNDSQMPPRQENADLEVSSDRSKGKRQVVQLYVPPSLRAKKASSSPGATPENSVTSSRDSSPAVQDSLTSSQNDIATHKSEVTENTPSPSIKEGAKGVIDGQEVTGKPKGRGRGRKKPEVEIYVPRALRAAKQDSKSLAKTDKDDEQKSITSDGQRRRNDPACDNYSEISKDPVEPAPAKLDGTSDHTLIGDPLHLDGQFYPQDDTSESPPLLAGDCAAKKMKHESVEVETHSHVSDNVHSEATGTVAVHSNSESASDPFTFEFYDPAVIAFMPSPQVVQNTSDQNNSSYFDHYSTQASACEHNVLASSANVSEDYSSDHRPLQVQNASSSQHQSVICAGDSGRESDLNIQAIELDVIEDEDVRNHRPSEERLLSLTKHSVEEHSFHTGASPGNQDLTLSENSSPGCDPKFNIDKGHSKVQSEHGSPSSAETHEGSQCDTAGCQKEVDDNLPLDKPSSITRETQQRMAHVKKIEKKCEEMDSKQSDEQSPDSAGLDDEESWDAMFDDNGDCLDESLVKELTEFVGRVEIDKPKINYLNYEPKEPDLDLQAFSHIVEIYDFSPELATCDLIAAFREFSSRGFDVKWVDDTHALGVFSSAVAANEALKMIHPLLKVRPMSQASKKGQNKARHCQEFLQPYKARPETTSIAARRLVAGALGMAPRVSREVREQERKKLKEAKEKRRQERQQKIDMWDGSFGKCAMDEEDTGSR